MGADIHMFLQRRKNPKAKWELHPGHVEGEYGLEELTGGDRWYEFFGHLGGVRGNSNRAIAACKGLPKDCPDKLIEQSTDDHSHSYCTLKQFETAVIRAMKSSDHYESFEEEMDRSEDTTLFWDWQSHIYGDGSPGYFSILRYCNKWIWETKVENGLAGIKTDLNKPQIRFIYYFDS